MSSLPQISPVRIGVIGAGLMGREVASVFGRWFALEKFPVPAELVAVCDVQISLLDWFRQVPTVNLFTTDHRELLARADVDVVYVAVPHHLHELLYLDVLRAGKDLLAEKPFGIDRPAAERIRAEAEKLKRFVRISSEFPFFPGAQRVWSEVKAGRVGKVLEARSSFCHSSDLDSQKPINWKRQNKFCGEAGVMNDLGMHVTHVPLRLGWRPQTAYAELQKIYAQRPDGRGGLADCDTWDNACVHTKVVQDSFTFPLTLETKRLAPGETNSWSFSVLGTAGGFRFSTKEPKSFWRFELGKEQWWARTDLGFGLPFKTITGGIFEPGFPDILMQMWAAYLAERAGLLDGRFGCVTPDEAIAQHAIWEAAIVSQRETSVAAIHY